MNKPVKFNDILEGVEYVSSGRPMEHEAYLSLETGAVYFHSEYFDGEPLPEDIGEAGKYLVLPHKMDLGIGKALAFKFTREFMPEALEKATGIFARSGAFARFKTLLESHGLLKQWYEYEEKIFETALRAWCKENKIEVK